MSPNSVRIIEYDSIHTRLTRLLDVNRLQTVSVAFSIRIYSAYRQPCSPRCGAGLTKAHQRTYREISTVALLSGIGLF